MIILWLSFYVGHQIGYPNFMETWSWWVLPYTLTCFFLFVAEIAFYVFIAAWLEDRKYQKRKERRDAV